MATNSPGRRSGSSSDGSPEGPSANRTTYIVAVIGVGGAVLAAVVGAAFGARLEAGGTISAGPTVTVTRTATATATATVSTAPTAQATSSGSASATPEPTQEVGPVVRRAGEMGVPSRAEGGVDIDAPPSDPRWGNDGPGMDLTSGITGGGWQVYPTFGVATIAAVGDTVPTYDDCVASQQYSAGSYLFEDGPGTSICMITSSGRYASLTLTDISGANPVFDVTVWEDD